MMNTKILSAVLSLPSEAAGYDNHVSYLIGGIIALFILGYLVYTLINPDKF